MSDSKQDTGAVRSDDADHLDFTSLPLVGLIGVARTASEGKTKYGSHNYMLGFPVHQYLNHSMRHITMFLLGDRSEPHLEHASWGLLAASQTYTLDPEGQAAWLLGPGATVTAAMKARLDADAPGLAAKRKSGVFDKLGEWSMRGLSEIKTILGQRSPKSPRPYLSPEKRQEIMDELVQENTERSREMREKFAALTDSHVPLKTVHPGGLVTYPELALATKSTSKLALKPFEDGETLHFGSKPAADNKVKPTRACGNPESFDYYDPDTGTTKTTKDHQGGCPPLP